MGVGKGSGTGGGDGRGRDTNDVVAGSGLCIGLICCCFCVGFPLFVGGIFLLVAYSDEQVALITGIVLVVLSVIFCVVYVIIIIYVCSGGCNKRSTVHPQVLTVATGQPQYAPGQPQYAPGQLHYASGQPPYAGQMNTMAPDGTPLYPGQPPQAYGAAQPPPSGQLLDYPAQYVPQPGSSAQAADYSPQKPGEGQTPGGGYSYPV